MKNLRLFAISLLMMCASLTLQAATASFSNGKLTLDFIGDWAVVENGNGNISIVDVEGIQLATVVGEPDYDMTNTGDYQVLVYNVNARIDAGTYTVKIADGAINGHKTDPWSYNLSSIGALELPLVVTGEGGQDEPGEVASFGDATMSLVAGGTGINVKYTYPDSFEPEDCNKVAATGKTATLYEDGVEVATGNFDFFWDPIFYGAHFDYTEVEGKEYKAVFPEGCWYIEQIDELGNSTIVLTSPSAAYSWIGGSENGTVVDPSQPGEEPNPGDDDDPIVSPVTVDFKLGSRVAAITNNMVIANITVDRAYYDIYWTVTCATDPDFFFGGSFGGASAGAGTYTITASTPSSQPVELNSGNVYTFTFNTCEFGWDPYKTVATFEVEGAGSAAEQFSDIVITSFDGTPGVLGYAYKKNYTFTFSAPVYDVKAFAALGMDGNQNFPVTQVDAEGLTWSVDVSSMANDEGAFEMHITARDASNNLRLKGTYNLDHSFIYTISLSNSTPDDDPSDDPDLPSEEVEIATITIGETVYQLSQEEPIELATYPEGAVFTITLADEAIKKVTYEIIDTNTNEILKSIADLNKGEEGKWTATMPRSYEMVAGHLYYVHVVALDGMSSFTSNVLMEFNFQVMGTNADVAVYSNVKVVNVTPSTSEVITVAAPVITITFSEAIASVSAKAILGQMYSTAIPAGNITTEDNTTWAIAVPAGCIQDGALSLDIVAIDNEGNRVTDEHDGVGSPVNCYLQYGWASTVGLPVPELEENGTIVESLECLTFTYEGIGLNQDNNTATWKEISIACNGEKIDMELTENMFSVSGDASVGGSVLTLTLPEALKQNGVYTITVPAYAFVLGHDNYNWFNGDCEFTVTVQTATGINTVEGQQQGILYNLNGQKVEHANGGIYIQNGHKVIVK